MIQEVFYKVISMSLTAGAAALVLAALRPLLMKIPAWIRCFLWVLVGIRMVCPISIKSRVSLAPDFERYLGPSSPQHYVPTAGMIDSMSGAYSGQVSEGASAVTGSISAFQISSIVWIVGIAAMITAALISLMRINKATSVSMNVKDNIFVCDGIDSPFVKGILRPKIYVPSGLDEQTVRMALEHEFAHIKRKDNLLKAAGYAVLTFHWFNPAAWIAYILLCRDIECACDEKTVLGMDLETRAGYSEAILRCSSVRIKTVGYVGFGGNDIKGRIKHVLSYRKPSAKLLSLSAVMVVVFAMLFLTSQPIQKIGFTEALNSGNGSSVHVMQVSSQNAEDNGKMIQKYLYDKEGQLQKQVITDESGDVISYREYTNDDNGWISEIHEFDKDGNLVSNAEYTRDKNGNELSYKAYYNDNSFCWWNEFEYDREGNPSKYVRYNEDGSVLCRWESSFNSEGSEIERVCYDSEGEKLWTQQFTYDSMGNLEYTEQYDADGKMKSHTEYSYA